MYATIGLLVKRKGLLPGMADRLTWPAFEREVIRKMKPGEHACLIGPTGRGKSTLAMHLLRERPYVVVLDAKGGDDTLDRSGFEVVHRWPLEDEAKRVRSGEPIRVILRPRSHTRDRLAEAHDLFSECIERSLQSGWWTLYVDELRLTSEGRTIDLAPEIEVAYMTGRGRRVTFISSTQAPRWIPRAAYDQATHQFHWPIMDQDALKRQAEISGIGRQNFMEQVSGMSRHEALYVHPPDTAYRVKFPKLKPVVREVVSEVREMEEAEAPVQAERKLGKLGERLWG